MNRYEFYYKGKLYCTCYTNEVAENHISACADLARKGLTPYMWHNPDTGKDGFEYTGSFSVRKDFKNIVGEPTSKWITPRSLSSFPKSIQKELKAFDYDYETDEWIARV